ncbi:DUF3841 domain-containing protein [Sporosalibacterium faouarense]|uniref:DUF3841 domain-containing protein n=1 Tax=Sporosalibacterium faouarense TaxID=516123 RepID=UPI00192C861E
MGEKIKVWTRQHKDILDILDKKGRYTVKKKYIVDKMEEHSNIFLDVYDWYTRKAQEIIPKPKDVKYPIWVSLSNDFMLRPIKGTVVLEICIDEDLVITMDIDKWGRIVNYWYVPLNDEDEQSHNRKLKKYGLSDGSSAYMSNFYPHLKNEIIKSWDRLFDNSYSLSEVKQGTIWEVKKEWITKIIE